MPDGLPGPAGDASCFLWDATINSSGGGERWGKGELCWLFSSFETTSNISCPLDLDFDTRGFCGHERGRGRLRSSVHVAWKEGELSACYSFLVPAPVSHYNLSLPLRLFEWLPDVRRLWEQMAESEG